DLLDIFTVLSALTGAFVLSQELFTSFKECETLPLGRSRSALPVAVGRVGSYRMIPELIGLRGIVASDQAASLSLIQDCVRVSPQHTYVRPRQEMKTGCGELQGGVHLRLLWVKKLLSMQRNHRPESPFSRTASS